MKTVWAERLLQYFDGIVEVDPAFLSSELKVILNFNLGSYCRYPEMD